MRLLLDIHALIWWVSSSEQLPKRVLDLLEDAENSLFLSVASIWEMQIKCQNGKLELGKPLSQLISNQQANNSLAILLVEPSHVYEPGDRRRLKFVSADRMVSGYPVRWIG